MPVKRKKRAVVDTGDLEARVLELWKRFYTVKREDVIEEIRRWGRGLPPEGRKP